MAVKYGEWAFLIGIALAVVVGIFSSFIGAELLPIVVAVLVLLGLVVGFMNIKEKEITAFLIATIALLSVAYSWQPLTALFSAYLGAPGGVLVNAINGFMSALVAFIAPAAFIVALKQVYNLAQP